MGIINISVFETEKLAKKMTSNLHQVKEPQCCFRQYLPQRLFIDFESVRDFEAIFTVTFT